MKFDDIKKLHQKKYRAEFGYFLVEGEHLLLELQRAALQNPLLQRSQLYVSGAYEQWQSPFETHVISDRQMAHIADTKTPQGIIALVPMPAMAAPDPAPTRNERAIYLYEIQDPGNLGTILRTLAWFGNFRCLLSPGSVDPFNPKVVRSSMGAIFHTPMELDVELDSLRTRFERIACLDMNGDRLQSASFKTFDCYLFGNEARGVPREQLAALNAQPFTIPGCGAIESLNLATTVNMCAYELNR
ncbi:RNA methyltransferase [Pseudomonas resinovorans]|uniref:RNA methyltransferase n=1 Tax=Metapseudomonas resinovorans TaxID=53412 RepID=A0ABT4Y3G0_METRE|nr:RNA methyltransferase [Pseudomonas resinovorans]MDA8483390.1 RNA methyltransferase [Pseudomonas resinovorans]